MPVVPYNQRQVRSAGLPSVAERSPVNVGQATAPARDLQALGADLTKVGYSLSEKLKEQQDADLLFRAETALREDYLKFENEARKRRGQQAWGLVDDASSWWDEAGKKYSESLTNDDQRRLFAQTATKMKLQSISQFSEYEEDQRVRSLEEATKASLNTLVNTASNATSYFKKGELGQADSGRVAAVQDMKNDGLRRIEFQAQTMGWTPERKELEKTLFTTKFHKQVIQSRIESDPEGAKAYFKMNQEEISGDERLQLDKLISEGAYKVAAQDFATKALNENMTETEALRYARENFSGDEEDMYVTEIRAQYGELSAARGREQSEAADEAFDILARTGRYSAVPVDVLNRMDGKTRLALRKEARAISSGKNVETNDATYYALQTMAAEKPGEFGNLDLRQYYDKLSPSDRQEMARLQASVLKADNNDDLRTFQQQYSQAFKEMGLESDDAELKGKFERAVNTEVYKQAQEKGRQLTYRERQDIIDQQMFNVELEGSGWLWDTDKRMFEMTATERARYELSPSGETRDLIIDALQAEGKPVTEKAIQERFNMRLSAQ